MSKKTKLIVAGIIRNSEGLILATQRKSDDVHGGGWEFPGGKIEHNEQPEKALKREILEELSLEIEIQSIFNAIQHEYENFTVFIVFYLCSVKSMENLSLNAHDKILWLPIKKLKDVDFLPADIGTVEKIMEDLVYEIQT